MKPIELYNRKPESETKDLNLLRGSYYNHIPEINEIDCSYFSDEILSKNNRIIIKIYKDFNFDYRRFWRLASVWLDTFPVMIIQNAGREGDDHSARFITDESLYIEMIDYIKGLLPKDHISTKYLFDSEVDILNLDKFYGNELDGNFQRS